MVSAPESTIAAAAQARAGDDSDPAAEAARAQVNLGDTVRASWKFSLDAVRANIAHCSPEAKELLVWAFLYCTDPAHPLRFQEFAARIGYPENTLYKVYHGKYLDPKNDGTRLDAPDKLVRAIRSFRRMEVQRAKLGRTTFVATPTAKRVFLACDLARESQTPVFVEGASHVGKTVAFRQYAADNNHGHTILVEIEAVSGLGGLVKAIAAKLGISPKSNTQDLIERIKKAITRDMVLIFDEMHLLANTYRAGSYFACVEALRRIYDFTQCGMVLSYTKLGFEKAEKERKRELEQIFRRGVHRVNLGDRPTADDVRLVIESWGLAFPARHEEVSVQIDRRTTLTEQPFALLAELAREAGLKAIVERLRYATKLAADAGAEISWELFVRAHLIIKKNAAAPLHGWEAEA